jgi:hypothetical protein
LGGLAGVVRNTTMDRNTERIELYLSGIEAPETASDPHRRQLRRQVLGDIERRQTMSVKARTWKVLAIVAALIGTGTAATAVVGVKIHQYHFEGRGADGRYHFRTEPEIVCRKTYQDANGVQEGFAVGGGGGVVISASDPNQTIDVEQAQRDLEEIDRLRQQDIRRLVGVVDTELNGRFYHRTFRYEYTLSDGRTKTIGEGGPETDSVRSPAQIKKDHDEIDQLRQQNRRELVRVNHYLVGDEIHRFCSFRYVLADGREMTVGEGDLELPSPRDPLGTEVIREVSSLRRLKQGTFAGYEDRDVQGRLFTFETYVFTLADGTVVTHAVGEPKGIKTSLTARDLEQLRALMEADKGEDLGTEEKVVLDRAFSFRKQRFILDDGTEIIRSTGTPMDSQ